MATFIDFFNQPQITPDVQAEYEALLAASMEQAGGFDFPGGVNYSGAAANQRAEMLTGQMSILDETIAQIAGVDISIMGGVDPSDPTNIINNPEIWGALAPEQQSEIMNLYQQRERIAQEMVALRGVSGVANLEQLGAGGYADVYGQRGSALPNLPAWAQGLVVGGQVGQPIQPGVTRLASGQTMSRLTPSQLQGLGGFIDWSAGNVAGAPASFEDWLQRSQQLLPTRAPVGSQRFAPSAGL